MTDLLLTLTHDVARQYVGDTFWIRVENGPTIELRLEEVVLLMEKHVNPRMKRDSFSLQFRGPSSIPLRQGTFPLYHDKLGGPIELFLVPIGQETTGFLYEAVFT